MSLEDMVGNLVKQAEAIGEGNKAVKAEGARIRRKSKELAEQLDGERPLSRNTRGPAGQH